MPLIYTILYGIWWGFLRRWFGGLFSEDKHKFLSNRGLQTIFMMASLFPVLYICTHNTFFISLIYEILYTSILTAWIQFQFWSRGHGCILDMGRNKNPDITRYDRWYADLLDYIWDKGKDLKTRYTFFNKLLKNWSCKKYGYSYDISYTLLRYTCPMLLTSILMHSYIPTIIGLFSAPTYEACHRYYEKHNYKWMSYQGLNAPHKLAEIIYGFIFGAGILTILWTKIGMF